MENHWKIKLRRVLSIAGRVGMAVLVGYCLLVLGADWFARSQFGLTIDGDWFLLLMASGDDELRAFFAEYWKGIVGTAAVTLLVIVVVSAAIWRWPKWAAGALAAGAVCLALGGSTRIASFKPIYFAWDTIVRVADYNRLGSIVRAERRTERPPLRASGRNRLVIIGESLTSRRMGVYGYGKNTTPCLSRLVETGALEVRPERRAKHPYTARALMDMMLDAEHTQVWRDRMDGYRTVFITAQDRWERYGGVSQLLFDACDERTYVRHSGRPVYDEELVEVVRAAMEGPSPWVIYVQMMGSHFNPRDRVPPDFRSAAQGRAMDFDDYDWSVLYTDSVVARLIEMAGSADVHFTSDHGESVNAGRWRDPSDDSLWFVPEIASAPGPQREGIRPSARP